MTALVLLARDVGTHERTLRRAVNEGLVRAIRPTPRTLTLPLAEWQYVRRTWPLLSRLREVLRTEPNVRFAMLFGSVATGLDTPMSDIDILVDLRDPSFDRVVNLESRLASITGRPVDVLRLQDKEADPSFLADAIADGRVLVDREGRWTRLRSREPSLRLRGREQQARRAQAALNAIDVLLGV